METGNKRWYACAFCAVFMCLSGRLAWGMQGSPQSKIDQYSAQASHALADRNLPEAEAALQKLAALTPRSASVHAQLGLVYYLENRYAQAAQSFRKALTLDPQLPNASLMLGICLSEIGRYSEAVPLLAPVFRSPPNAQAQRLVGLELLHAYKNLRQFSDADGVAQELLRRYPDDPEIIYHVSRLYGDQSLSLILRLMKKAPNSAWVHLVFAQINEDEGRYNSAITQYRLALQLDPRLPGLHFNLGRALLLSSDSDQARGEALKEFEEDLAANPQNSLAEYEIGEIYRRAGKLDKALPFFERAIQFNPQFEEAQIALSRSLIGLNQPRQALIHLLAAARLNPANSVSHFLLARVYEELGNRAAQQREMALFRKYRVQPYSNPNGSAFQVPASFGAPKVTPQVLESNPSK